MREREVSKGEGRGGRGEGAGGRGGFRVTSWVAHSLLQQPHNRGSS